MDTSFDYIQVLVVIGSGALSWVTFSSSVTSSSLGDALKFGRRCKILESGAGGWGASSRLVSSRLVSGAEVDSSIYTGNKVVV